MSDVYGRLCSRIARIAGRKTIHIPQRTSSGGYALMNVNMEGKPIGQL